MSNLYFADFSIEIIGDAYQMIMANSWRLIETYICVGYEPV
tara:strand:+ start:642 stop:764 length:123 start_codon:yes stop_codon:yes gene_type:complete